MFDKVELNLKAGNGGNGAISFRREKFVPYGGPDGGDGGNGGGVIFKADNSVTDYRAFRNKGIYKAEAGKNGMGKKKHGKNGKDLILAVPIGTVIFTRTDAGAGDIIADLNNDGQTVVVANGGMGGLGNVHFATSTHQAPEIAQAGERGKEISVILDLRLIADVGIIGYPNVGKSSLLAVSSAANPRIGDFPFTTKQPVLGVVEVGNDSFVMAEIPGLIVGAHLGKGLGHDFLQHSLRTRLFIHLIDGGSTSPVNDMIAVNNELGLYDPGLLQKTQIVAVNKIDKPEVRTRIPEITGDFQQAGVDVLFVSAATGEGIKDLMDRVWEKLKFMLEAVPVEPVAPPKVFRPEPRDTGITVHREDGVFVINAPWLSRIVSLSGGQTPELLDYVRKQLLKHGVDKLLKKAGSQPGDKIRCGSVEWEWYE